MAKPVMKPNWLDRVALAINPKWGLERLKSRAVADVLVRHFEAAQPGRRTDSWHRSAADVNAAAGAAIPILRSHARDLARNNAWARNALRVISDNVVGWGITPTATGAEAPAAMEAWRLWGETTDCDAASRMNFYGLQALAMRSIAESGEVLIRKRPRRPKDNLPVPLQLEILESDHLDTNKFFLQSESGGPIIFGVEHDKLMRRTGYWLYPKHPGSMMLSTAASVFVPEDQVLHLYLSERPGQVRGVTWFASVLMALKDFDEFEDATLMRQKVAALFAAFVVDPDGAQLPLGAEGSDAVGSPTEMLEPGLISYLPPGKQVTFGNPPLLAGDTFSVNTLRRIAAGLGVTYEDMTGDFSQVNFSSARMSRIRHYAAVHNWRWNMLIPQLCDGVWGWFVDAAIKGGVLRENAPPGARWTAPPMPMIEPDKEGIALSRLVRIGAMTPDEMVRQQGFDPATHWQEYAENFEELDELGVVLDSDPRKMTQAGQVQQALPAAESKVESESEATESDGG
jgi:lambda family phage portal protein